MHHLARTDAGQRVHESSQNQEKVCISSKDIHKGSTIAKGQNDECRSGLEGHLTLLTLKQEGSLSINRLHLSIPLFARNRNWPFLGSS